MFIKDESKLKEYIIQKLETNKSEANIDMLADYILYVIRSLNNFHSPSTQNDFVSKIQDFLGDYTMDFVRDIYSSLDPEGHFKALNPVNGSQSPTQPSYFEDEEEEEEESYGRRGNRSSKEVNSKSASEEEISSPDVKKFKSIVTIPDRAENRVKRRRFDTDEHGNFRRVTDPRSQRLSQPRNSVHREELIYPAIQEESNSSTGKCLSPKTSHTSTNNRAKYSDRSENQTRPSLRGNPSRLSDNARYSRNSDTREKRNFKSNSLDIRNIPPEFNTFAHITNYFSKFGELEEVKSGCGPDGKSGFVRYKEISSAEIAHKSTEAVFGNRFVKVFFSRQGLENGRQKRAKSDERNHQDPDLHSIDSSSKFPSHSTVQPVKPLLGSNKWISPNYKETPNAALSTEIPAPVAAPVGKAAKVWTAPGYKPPVVSAIPAQVVAPKKSLKWISPKLLAASDAVPNEAQPDPSTPLATSEESNPKSISDNDSALSKQAELDRLKARMEALQAETAALASKNLPENNSVSTFPSKQIPSKPHFGRGMTRGRGAYSRNFVLDNRPKQPETPVASQDLN
eukprot:Sdes_comp10027_c0_seq1m1617